MGVVERKCVENVEKECVDKEYGQGFVETERVMTREY